MQMRLRLLINGLGYLLLLSLIQWVGPHVSVFGVTPLQSTLSRVIAAVVLGLCIALPLIWRAIPMRKRSHQLEHALTDSRGNPRESDLISEQEEALSNKFQQALAQLKPPGMRVRWWQRLTPAPPLQSELPWYVWIGPSGSGKSTALLNSSLRFALQQGIANQGSYQATPSFSGTKLCEWWFSDEAVWIDTAGRFTTQDSDPLADSGAWRSFLELVNTHRPSQGLNGVLIALSVEDLLGKPERCAQVLRCVQLRLHELSDALGVSPPAYILLTKMDHVLGFEDSFRLLPKEDAGQAWGINFPRPELSSAFPVSPSNRAHTMSPTLQEGIEHLCKRLGEQCLERLAHEPSLERRKRIFQFPTEFTRCMLEVAAHLEALLSAGTRFEKPLNIRGLYLSSGTQLNNGLQALTGELSRQSLQGGAVHTTIRGRAYFIEHLLKQVVLGESHLATSPTRGRRWQSRLVWGSGFVSLLLLVGLTFGWMQSHHLNREWLSSKYNEAVTLRLMAQSVPIQTSRTLDTLIPLLSGLRQQAQAPLAGVPWSQRLGLDQSEGIRAAFQSRYHALLSQHVTPLVQGELESQLQTEIQSPSTGLYPTLQAYLMWFAPEHYQAEHIWAMLHQEGLGSGLGSKRMNHSRDKMLHMEAAIELGPPTLRTGPDDQLIEKARRTLAALDPLELMLDSLRQQAEAKGIPRFDPTSHGGTELSSLLVREGGKPLSEGPAGFWTRHGLMDTWATGPTNSPEGLDKLRRERQWVMGEPAREGDLRRTLEQLQIRHFQNAVDEWEFYLGQIHVRPVGQLSEAVELARLLALPHSALQVFLQSVSKETEFAVPSIAMGLQAGNQGLVQGQGLEAFEGLHRLFDGEGENYRKVEALFHQLYLHLSAIQAAHRGRSLPPDPTALEAIRSQAALLPNPLRGVIEALGLQAQNHSEQTQRQALQKGLGPTLDQCVQMTQGRYPFIARSHKEVLPQDFKRLFDRQGLLDEIRTGSSQSELSMQATENLNRAKRIQALFFAGTEPGFNFEVRLKSSTPDGLSLLWAQNNQAHTLSPNTQIPLTWSLKGQGSEIKLRALDQTTGLEFSGPWAMYRLLDAGQIQRSTSPERFSWRVQIQGQFFELEFVSSSALNPLRAAELRQFRCPGVS